jgi:formamidopyrimidine-DNA glycosylase
MPELPEVETIARKLREGGPNKTDDPAIIGLTILEAHIYWDRTIAEPDAAEFACRITGQKVIGIGRRGKYLVHRLEQDWMLIHLRMSGDLLLGSSEDPLAPHDRLVLDLDGGIRLRFNDPRKFGRVWLVDDPQTVLKRLGPEPFDPSLNDVEFHRRLGRHRRPIKSLLLDQEFIAGIGNIYADEALFAARIHPQTRSDKLGLEASGRLLRAIRAVLEEGIRRNGASIDWVYRGGEFQNQFQVYQREGLECLHCGAPISRIVLGQRGTHFCPVCQVKDQY